MRVSRRGHPAVADEPDAGDRNQLLELDGGAAAQDDHVGELTDKPAQRKQGVRPGDRLRWILDDLSQRSVEVGDEDDLAGRHCGDRRFPPGVKELVGLEHYLLVAGRWRSTTAANLVPGGSVPSEWPQSPSRREAQKASAVAVSPNRSSREPWSTIAMRSTIRRARDSGSVESVISRRSWLMDRLSRGSEAAWTSAKNASTASGSRAMARSTSSAFTLPEPSQIELSGASRYSRGKIDSST